jgi:hypothetical protein
MCNPFFREFQLLCYIAILFTTEAVDERVDPERRLAHLSSWRPVALNFVISDRNLLLKK